MRGLLAEKAAEHPVPGGTRGFIKPEPHDFAKDEPLIVLQHPAAKRDFGGIPDRSRKAFEKREP